MNELVVRPSTLSGIVKVSGAKNSALKLLTASLLIDHEVELTNYPSELADAQVHVEMLRSLGKNCEVEGGAIRISGKTGQSLAEWRGRSIRNTLLMLGALVAKTGYGCVPLPGGCDLGGRGFDIHELVLTALGAKVWVEKGNLCARSDAGLVGAEVTLPLRSTGATENAIMCGTLASGVTIIWNPHVRPEILELAQFINAAGGCVTVYGQERIVVNGVGGLHGVSFRVMPDNMEAVTWLIAAAITGGDIQIEEFPFADLASALIHLEYSGVRLFKSGHSAIVRDSKCYPIDISTGPHPSINSDVQPLMAAFAACARGESRIIDLRFPGRYGYAAELRKMGVQCEVVGNLLKIEGNKRLLRGAAVKAVDLRAGASLALLAMAAEGETRIKDAWQIARGYNEFVSKARTLGADLESVE